MRARPPTATGSTAPAPDPSSPEPARQRGGLVLLILLIAVASLCEVLSPHDPRDQYPERADTEPILPGVRFFSLGDDYRFWGLWQGRVHLLGLASGAGLHLLGTDDRDRDILSRSLYALRYSLLVAGGTAAVSVLVGVMAALAASLAGGWGHATLRASATALSTMPGVLVSAALAAGLSPPLRGGIPGLIIVLAAVLWVTPAMTITATVRRVASSGFVQAARLANAGEWAIFRRHLLPAALRGAISAGATVLPAALVAESVLSFLGIGLQGGVFGLGSLLAGAADPAHLSTHPLLMAPAVLLAVSLVAADSGATWTRRRLL